MASTRKGPNETPARQIRVPQDLWEDFETATGPRGRAAVLVEFMKWYVREPRSKLPRRPDKPVRVHRKNDEADT